MIIFALSMRTGCEFLSNPLIMSRVLRRICDCEAPPAQYADYDIYSCVIANQRFREGTPVKFPGKF